MIDELLHGDCLAILPTLPSQSIDMILCDLPYGKTAAKWDSILPMDMLWREYKRLIKPRGAIVLTAVQPFTSLLVTSNLRWYRHSWVWDKGMGIGVNCKIAPIPSYEDILVFAADGPNYYPQMLPLSRPYTIKANPNRTILMGKHRAYISHHTQAYPKAVIGIPRIGVRHPERIHPTQKPVALFEYLIRTYTQPGALVLDHCAGSMTTAIACLRINRHYCCIEQDNVYFAKGSERVAREWRKPVAMTMWETAG